MKASFDEIAPGRFRVGGELNFANVTPLWRTSQWLLKRSSHNTVTIDLADVSQADSAALALLLEWLRLAERCGFELRFLHLPAHLVTMTQTYNLDPILPTDG